MFWTSNRCFTSGSDVALRGLAGAFARLKAAASMCRAVATAGWQYGGCFLARCPVGQCSAGDALFANSEGRTARVVARVSGDGGNGFGPSQPGQRLTVFLYSCHSSRHEAKVNAKSEKTKYTSSCSRMPAASTQNAMLTGVGMANEASKMGMQVLRGMWVGV